jgi:hypothetical protein
MTAPNREYTIEFTGTITVEASDKADAYEKAEAAFSELKLNDGNYDIEEGDCVMCNGTGLVAVGHESDQVCLCKKEDSEAEELLG